MEKDGDDNGQEPANSSNGDGTNEIEPEPLPGTSKDDGTKRKKASDKMDKREPKNAKIDSDADEDEEMQETVASGSGNNQPIESTSDCSGTTIDKRISELRKVVNNFTKRSYRRNRSSSDDDEEPADTERERSRTDGRGRSSFRFCRGAVDEDGSGMDLASSPSSTESNASSQMSLLEQVKERYNPESAATPEVMLKPKPKHKWFATPEVVSRQIGYSNRLQGPKLFEERMHGSLHAVQRLELMYKLESHTGCVNSLNFNSSGSLLASCSDDLSICLWDWPIGKELSSVDSGHKSNVFQAKFLPLQGHIFIGTCARDGQVRILELNSDGSLFNRRQAGQHYRPCHKLALIPDSPHVFLSCGEDSVVLSVDIRQNRASKVLSVASEGVKIPLYSVSCHPLNSNEFMVGGRDRCLRIYDRRQPAIPELMLCPNHLKAGVAQYHAYITCAVYNYNGSELLASYNDEDIYLWDRRDTTGDFVHKYQGHRNNATIKGVNFFGPRSEYIVSGSDCGNIFFWDKETEAIVQWMAGDENGVVNCLEPHPTIPVLATSGLDEDVKIWVPSNELEPTFDGLKAAVIINQKDREDERSGSRSADVDGQMLWLLWRHINRVSRRLGASYRDSGNQDDDSTPSMQNMFQSSSPELSSDDDEERTGTFNYSDCSPS